MSLESEFSCIKCGEPVNPARWEIGYNICMKPNCAYKPPTRTVVPMHKSNYILVDNREDLKGINNKGGFYR
jgi:hypothetical protein